MQFYAAAVRKLAFYSHFVTIKATFKAIRSSSVSFSHEAYFLRWF